jgi:hypothetical protein
VDDDDHPGIPSPSKMMPPTYGGGGGDDEDSDGVEFMREQMLLQAQKMVADLDAKLTSRIEQELANIRQNHEHFVEVIEMKLGDQHAYSNAIKDELDRLAERMRQNHGELLNYNKNIAVSLKKVRSEQLGQEEDANKAWGVVSVTLECLQTLMT